MTSSRRTNGKENNIWSYALRRKDVRKLLILIVVLIILVCYLSGRLTRTIEVDTEGYPRSTLTTEPTERRFIKSDALTNTLGCPTVPYDISIPGTILDSTAVRLSSEYNEYSVTLLETNDDAITALNKRLPTYAMDTVDVPSVEWVDVIYDEGYVNSYKATYHTGLAKIETKMKSYIQYGAMYEIFVEGDTNLMIYVSCENKDDLANGKDILDSIVYMLVPQNEPLQGETTEVDTEIDDEQSDEDKGEEGATNIVAPETENMGIVSSEDSDSYVLENGTVVSNQNGIKTYSKDYSIYIDKDFDEAIYITFSWINYEYEPIDMYVLDPSGKKYSKDKELSRSGEWVFIVPKGVKGTYTLHGDAASTIIVSYYDAMDEASWYRTYRNIDITTDGDPVRGFSE